MYFELIFMVKILNNDNFSISRNVISNEIDVYNNIRLHIIVVIIINNNNNDII